MRILVTGGAGYIGSHAVRLFLARGHDVWVYDNLSKGHRRAVPADRLIVADLDELPRLDHALVAHRIEAVVHYAAWSYVGESVPEQMKLDLTLEQEAIKMLNDGIELCRSLGDNGSRELLEKILVAEEEHTDWLETQIGLIQQLGEAHYLSQQIES